MFLAIAVDNLSNPETLVEAQKLNDDQRPESKRESESEGEMRNYVDDGVDDVGDVDDGKEAPKDCQRPKRPH